VQEEKKGKLQKNLLYTEELLSDITVQILHHRPKKENNLTFYLQNLNSEVCW